MSKKRPFEPSRVDEEGPLQNGESHSVARHLRLEIDSYDASIRRFIRGYEAMLDEAVSAVLDCGALERVIDLGAGTGALSERLLERHPTVIVELWDIDPEMQGKARERLARFGERAVFRLRSYSEPIAGVDAVMASLALHHVRELDDKWALYASIAAGLRPGGLFANADVTMPAEEQASRAEYRLWADHLVASGIDEARAFAHFEEWSGEDRYFSLEQELEGVRRAGLVATCRFRLAPSTVIVGRRPTSPP